jgi:hypothetical protein
LTASSTASVGVVPLQVCARDVGEPAATTSMPR